MVTPLLELGLFFNLLLPANVSSMFVLSCSMGTKLIIPITKTNQHISRDFLKQCVLSLIDLQRSVVVKKNYPPRVDVRANTATLTTYHRQLPPMGIAIMMGCMDMWKMLREHIELTDEDKIEQLFYMMSETEGRPFPLEEFKELLASLPVDKVD